MNKVWAIEQYACGETRPPADAARRRHDSSARRTRDVTSPVPSRATHVTNRKHTYGAPM